MIGHTHDKKTNENKQIQFSSLGITRKILNYCYILCIDRNRIEYLSIKFDEDMMKKQSPKSRYLEKPLLINHYATPITFDECAIGKRHIPVDKCTQTQQQKLF